ncbi:MAG TPA: D-glycerate dehydrogenase [Anaerolineaceae bacterium]|nr:D-glycerate dehydrogenase [Anaerolineaceae bacterium]HPN50694.1 D-glycerate dehydrogenase [Anaerolineaceae bacterium]
MKPEVYITRRLPAAAMKRLQEFCQPEIWDSDELAAPYEEMRARLPGKAGLLCLLTDRVDAALMDAAPGLKVISQCAVGYDNIDVAAATARGIPVGNTPGALTETTADFAFALLMAGARRIVEGMDYVRGGHWKTWGLQLLLGQDIYGATLGIVGLGRIGAAVARRARGFNMRLLYHNRQRHPEYEAELGIEYRPLDELLAESDFISLHLNLTAQSRGLIGEREFNLMKPNAVLVNTARGGVVQTEALYNALKAGRIAHAALDVTDPEPLPADHKLLTLPNITIAPHIASASTETRSRIAMMAVENLEAGLQGRPLPWPVNWVG